MDYKYNIQTAQYPDIYMPGYGEIEQPSSSQSQQSNISENTSTDTNIDNNAYILFLYPNEAREINQLVYNKLNTLDYDGSIIFHEYPDKEALKNIIEQIEIPFTIEEVSPNWLKQLVEVIFLNEMNNRRKEHNN